MSRTRQILFVQGGGEGTHDDWDNILVASLSRELGDGWQVLYPRMPREDDPDFRRWSRAISDELAGLDDDAVCVGHSIGGTILLHTLAQGAPGPDLAALVLLSAPFVGTGGWPNDGSLPTLDLRAALPESLAIHVFHGLADETVPAAHAALYAAALPSAQVHLLLGRDHQLDGDLRNVAETIRQLDGQEGGATG